MDFYKRLELIGIGVLILAAGLTCGALNIMMPFGIGVAP